jgi:hypothetical protein
MTIFRLPCITGADTKTTMIGEKAYNMPTSSLYSYMGDRNSAEAANTYFSYAPEVSYSLTACSLHMSRSLYVTACELYFQLYDRLKNSCHAMVRASLAKKAIVAYNVN